MHSVYGIPTRKGPEADLVLRFIDAYVSSLPQDHSFSILIEPRLQNSFPDIIVIYWDPVASLNWRKSRLDLRLADYRLVQYLHRRGPQMIETLKAVFPRNLRASLRRLWDAGLADETRDGWALRALSEIYAIKRIISFEAKMSTSARAFEQALLNAGFSSESYLLTPTSPKSGYALTFAEQIGIGIWSYRGEFDRPLVKAASRPLPQSYLSWQLNDLVWGYSQGVNDGYRC